MKKERLHLRVTEDQKKEILLAAKNLGYDNITQYLIDSSLNKIKDRGAEKKGVMTHTIAASPTIDYRIDIGPKTLSKNNKFFASEKEFIPGGKGINVSLMLDKFNNKNTTVHYSSGFTGEFLWNELNRMGIEQFRINSQSTTRVNIKVTNDEGDLHLLNQKVEPINEYGKEEMLNYVSNNVNKDENLVLAGSFRSEDYKFVNQVLLEAKEKQANIIVDITMDNLESAIQSANPDLLVITKVVEDGYNKKQIYEILDKYIELGCKNVAFIEDINYIFFADQNDKFMIETPQSPSQSLIGLSDALAAAFIVYKDDKISERLTWIGASVKAKSVKKIQFDFEDILEYKKDIKIKTER